MPPKSDVDLEYCRLCQQIPGSVKITDNDKFMEQVFECTKIKINDRQMNLLPKSVCRFCKVRIERFFSYIQEIRVVDQKLHDQFWKSLESEPNSHSESLSTVELSVEQIEAESYKCPACPDIFTRYQNLVLHSQSHSNLHCCSCAKIFDNSLSHTDNTCEKSVDNADECSTIANEDSSTMTDEECNTIIGDNMSLLNATNMNMKEELKLSDIIGSTGLQLQEECVEVEFASEDDNEPNAEMNNNVVTDAIDGEASPSGKKQKRLSKVDADGEIESKGYFFCNICDKKYLHNSHLRAHQKIHGNSFPCPLKDCRKICTSAYSLETHMMKHKGKMPFLCSTCGKGLTTKSSLKCHEKIHAKVKEYICKECNISFAIQNTLRAHQKKEHEGVRYYCSQCPSAFTSKGSLERHELVHGGVRDFECDTCTAKFYTNKELVNHQRYHKGLRLYKCNQCYKTFYERHHLKIHMRFHTGEKPYVCPHMSCGKSFVDSQSLAQHRKSRHKSAK